MNSLYKLPQRKTLRCLVLTTVIALSGCYEFVTIDPPRTDLTQATVFENDATAQAAIIDVYHSMATSGFSSGSITSFSYIASYSSDEQINYSIAIYKEVNDNELQPANVLILNMWSQLYNTIYKVNAILEGLHNSSGISASMKTILQGEALFIRAFCHFYLVNLFGDVPLVITTDYRSNTVAPRTSSEIVYQQITDDLVQAKNLLPSDYAFANNEKVRVNKVAASALLARVYLFRGLWAEAQSEATEIIEHPDFSLVNDLNLVFRKNSSEAIWQFHTTFIANDFFTFRVTASGPNAGALRPDFVNDFEPNDNRRVAWVRSRINSGIEYFFPGKYKTSAIAADYSTLIRLAELYLIRAEAHTHLQNFQEAQNDINIIRNRAGLSQTNVLTMNELLDEVEKQRRFELFTEWGHRWLDLKRTNRVDDILAVTKGNLWQSTDALYPIPEYELLNNPSLRNHQNPGY